MEVDDTEGIKQVDKEISPDNVNDNLEEISN